MWLPLCFRRIGDMAICQDACPETSDCGDICAHTMITLTFTQCESSLFHRKINADNSMMQQILEASTLASSITGYVYHSLNMFTLLGLPSPILGLNVPNPGPTITWQARMNKPSCKFHVKHSRSQISICLADPIPGITPQSRVVHRLFPINVDSQIPLGSPSHRVNSF